MLKVAIFQFSGTGNTYYISQLIQGEMREKRIICDLYAIEALKESNHLIDHYDVIGLGYPIYGSSIPYIVRKWMNRLRFRRDKRGFVFCTQMMFSGDGAAYGARLLRKKGYRILEQEHFNMPNNITDYKIFKSSRLINYEKIESKNIKKVKRFVKNILLEKKQLTGSNPISLLLGLTQRIPYHLMERRFMNHAILLEKNCTLCNKCVELCPTKNFVIKDGTLRVRNRCILCYRCVNHCPVQALHINKRGLVDTPYHGPTKQFKIKDVMIDDPLNEVIDELEIIQ
ncbi:MAG: EFR1 family ferrodoxin [Acholeplasmataceae bacterium]|nr:EFR1 family ferrodoxin [Acholeplasmataceae bacterium]